MSQETVGDLLKEAGDYELTCLEAGVYEVEIVHVKPRETDVIPTFKVVAGPYQGKRTMGGSISWKGNAGPRFFQRMRELGLTKEWFAPLVNLSTSQMAEAVATAMTGLVVKAELNVEEPNKYHDDYRNKLVRFQEVVGQAAPVAAAPGAAAAPPPPAAAAPPVPVTVPATVPVAAPAPVAASVEAPSEVAPPPAPPVAAPAAPPAPPVPAPAVPPAPPAPAAPVAEAPAASPAAPPPPAAPAPAAPAAPPIPAAPTVVAEPDF